MKCPYCNQEHPEDLQFCPMTGQKIRPLGTCPNCGQPVEPGWQNCSQCGQKLVKTVLIHDPVSVTRDTSKIPTLKKASVRKPFRRWLIISIGGVLVIAALIFVFWTLLNPGKMDWINNKSAVDQVGNSTSRPSKIAFASDRDGYPEIYVMNNDGSGQTRLTNNQFSDIAPAWSSDGQQLLFLTDRDGNAEIYSMDIFGNNQVNLSNNPAYDIYADWSPDMQKIAFSSIRTGSFEIYVMNADGSNQIPLTNNPEEEGIPRWSPDGKMIAYTSILAGNMEINVMNADGSNQINLTNNPASDGSPTWSPDGEKIAFNSNRDGNWEIYVMNKDGTDQTRLTTNTNNYGYPDWSPEGNFIIFLSDQSGSWDIYVMNANGTNITPLLTGPTNDDSPRWSTGSTTINLAKITEIMQVPLVETPLSSPPPTVVAETDSVYGRAYISNTGEPVEIKVLLMDASTGDSSGVFINEPVQVTSTDPNGHYYFTGVLPGTYIVAIQGRHQEVAFCGNNPGNFYFGQLLDPIWYISYMPFENRFTIDAGRVWEQDIVIDCD